nr:hypothetical protein [Sicyoidochytrium minutum DNA virus]
MSDTAYFIRVSCGIFYVGTFFAILITDAVYTSTVYLPCKHDRNPERSCEHERFIALALVTTELAMIVGPFVLVVLLYFVIWPIVSFIASRCNVYEEVDSCAGFIDEVICG